MIEKNVDAEMIEKEEVNMTTTTETSIKDGDLLLPGDDLFKAPALTYDKPSMLRWGQDGCYLIAQPVTIDGVAATYICIDTPANREGEIIVIGSLSELGDIAQTWLGDTTVYDNWSNKAVMTALRAADCDGAESVADIHTCGIVGMHNTPQPSSHLLDLIRSALSPTGYPYGNPAIGSIDGYNGPRISVVDDQSKHPYNAEGTDCAVVDIYCYDGVVRVGYYSDNAETVLDDCAGAESCNDWARYWDADGTLPCYLWGCCGRCEIAHEGACPADEDAT